MFPRGNSFVISTASASFIPFLHPRDLFLIRVLGRFLAALALFDPAHLGGPPALADSPGLDLTLAARPGLDPALAAGQDSGAGKQEGN